MKAKISVFSYLGISFIFSLFFKSNAVIIYFGLFCIIATIQFVNYSIKYIRLLNKVQEQYDDYDSKWLSISKMKKFATKHNNMLIIKNCNLIKKYIKYIGVSFGLGMIFAIVVTIYSASF